MATGPGPAADTAASWLFEEGAWFGRPQGDRDAACLLFCLPHSGAGASAFRGWRESLAPRIAALPVRLPGREQRIGEPHRLDPEEIAAAVAARADRPYAVYGHSLGARLGFDVLRALRRADAPAPIRFYAAAARPPDVAEPLAAKVELPDEAFLAALAERISSPIALFEEPELRELLLPVLRADFEWLHRYAYRPEPPLDVPIVALAGEYDHEVGPGDAAGWMRHTSAWFQLRTVPGGHLFLTDAATRLTALLAEDLLRALRGPDRPDPGSRPPGPWADVWLADLDELADTRAAARELTPDETDQARHIGSAQERRRFIGRCLALRRLLRRYGVEPPADGGARQRPGPIRASIARHGNLLLAGFSADAIGVGIEPARPGRASRPRDARAAALRSAAADGATEQWQSTYIPVQGAVCAIVTPRDRRLSFTTMTERAR